MVLLVSDLSKVQGQSSLRFIFHTFSPVVFLACHQARGSKDALWSTECMWHTAQRMWLPNYRCRRWSYPGQVTVCCIVFSREFASPLHLEMECESFHMKYMRWRGTHKREDIWNYGFHSAGCFKQKVTVLDVCLEFMLMHCFTASVPLFYTHDLRLWPWASIPDP